MENFKALTVETTVATKKKEKEGQQKSQKLATTAY